MDNELVSVLLGSVGFFVLCFLCGVGSAVRKERRRIERERQMAMPTRTLPCEFLGGPVDGERGTCNERTKRFRVPVASSTGGFRFHEYRKREEDSEPLIRFDYVPEQIHDDSTAR